MSAEPVSAEGIGEDVRLSITTGAGAVLDLPLIHAAVTVRAGTGEVMPFLYRDPYDPEAPEAERPLRRAVVAIIDDQVVPGGVVR